ncbi:hypothetical protein [Microbacterium sp. SS28]|uniref:hypothetical protein n=1 Tax=Microbacterium sp. SS28 TaxID=2919948 RepID=UPI001FA9D25B|nr:hypothetical protein [Microbacterium sp. SS28]
MIEIARAELTSSASPERFVARSRDLATHPEWAAGMEYFRLADAFAVGARGVLKVRGGSEAPFVVTEYVEGRSYADTTILDGAELTVHHSASPSGAGSDLVLRAWVTGPRAAEYADQLRADVQRSLDADLAALAHLLESEGAA